jgi:hypothetical protein
MKIVINRCFGGFSLPIEFNNMYPDIDEWDIERTDETLIEFLETHNEYTVPSYTKLKVVEIPDTTTDWRIDEYDGAESILYVVDGKINEA